jgi:hypothetical protein
MEDYLDEIGTLLLDEDTPLREPQEGDPVQDVQPTEAFSNNGPISTP